MFENNGYLHATSHTHGFRTRGGFDYSSNGILGSAEIAGARNPQLITLAVCALPTNDVLNCFFYSILLALEQVLSPQQFHLYKLYYFFVLFDIIIYDINQLVFISRCCVDFATFSSDQSLMYCICSKLWCFANLDTLVT